jgi:hypothetical protein
MPIFDQKSQFVGYFCQQMRLFGEKMPFFGRKIQLLKTNYNSVLVPDKKSIF